MKCFFISVCLIFIFLSCSSDVLKNVYPTLNDGKYDSEFPYRSSSSQLAKIGNSIKLLNCIAYYKSYIFTANDQVKKKGIKEAISNKIFKEEGNFNKTGSGTATIISKSFGKVALLTCAHIVEFPDTIISYFYNDDGFYNETVQSVAIKTRQSNYIPDFPNDGKIDILICNTKNDIALVGGDFGEANKYEFEIYEYPNGKAKELEWGSFVYTMGFPMHYKMISKAIVSSPNRDNYGSFLIDAIFNRGSSGGIVFAIRDGVPNFELVGIISSVPAVTEFSFKPGELLNNQNYNPLIPYKGSFYLQQSVSIKYGVVKIVPIEMIKDFLQTNYLTIKDEGYDIQSFLNK